MSMSHHSTRSVRIKWKHPSFREQFYPQISSSYFCQNVSMERRDLLRVIGAGLAGTLAGCSGLGRDDGGYSVETEERVNGNYVINRVDFVDEAGTLGQVDQMETDEGIDNIVNNRSESEWEEMDTNDLDYAEDVLSENDATLDDIRPWVEDALDRELEGYPGIETADSPPGEDEPDERAIMYGIGMGLNESTAISNSFDSANVIKPLAEHFAAEYLDNDTFETWITSSAIPATEGRFAHLPVTMAYGHDGEIRRDYVEPAVPDCTLGEDGQAIRSPEDSLYHDEEVRDMVTGHEYSKALEMAQSGNIELEGRANPVRAISTALLGNMWSIVDSATNDITYEDTPVDGLKTHVSRSFGSSLEEAFYDLDAEKLQQMENIGRGIQLFYEDRGGTAGLAVGGTLEQPEFYEFDNENEQTLWNFEYGGDLSTLEG